MDDYIQLRKSLHSLILDCTSFLSAMDENTINQVSPETVRDVEKLRLRLWFILDAEYDNMQIETLKEEDGE
mgnify:CR=1 FL=1